jgi:DNA sulfur modification protein DndC
VLAIQDEVNQAAKRLEMPPIDLINAEELARIKELIDANTYPRKWDGTDPLGDELFDEILPDGSVQPLLFPNR